MKQLGLALSLASLVLVATPALAERSDSTSSWLDTILGRSPDATDRRDRADDRDSYERGRLRDMEPDRGEVDRDYYGDSEGRGRLRDDYGRAGEDSDEFRDRYGREDLDRDWHADSDDEDEDMD